MVMISSRIKNIPWLDRIAFPIFSILLWLAMERLLRGFGWPASAVLLLQTLILLAGALFFIFEWPRPNPGLPTPIAASRLPYVCLVAGVVGLSLLVRMHTLLDRPVWDDEMWTLRIVYGGSLANVIRISLEDYWPPLYYVLANLVCRVLDTGVLSLRLPSVVFGVASVAILPFVGASIARDRRAGLLAALLLAVSVSHIVFSQEARVYSLQVFLAILSAFTFYRSIAQGRFSATYVIVTLLLLYSHNFSCFFIAFQWSYLVLLFLWGYDWKQLRPILIAQAFIILLYIPLPAAFAYLQFTGRVPDPPLGTGRLDPSLANFVELYGSLAVRTYIGAALLAALTGLAVLGLVPKKRKMAAEHMGQGENSISKNGVPFLLCWVFVPAIASFALSILTPVRSFGDIRYHLTILPGICLLAGAGLCRLRSSANVGLAFLLVLTVGGVNLMKYYHEYDHAHIDEAARYVRANMEPGEQIYVGNAFRVFSYYFKDQYPRIGSVAWKDISRQFEGIKGQSMDGIVMYGNSRRSEKLPPFIHLIQGEIDRRLRDGKAETPFWLILKEADEKGILSPLLAQKAYSLDESIDFEGASVLRFLPAYAEESPRSP